MSTNVAWLLRFLRFHWRCAQMWHVTHLGVLVLVSDWAPGPHLAPLYTECGWQDWLPAPTWPHHRRQPHTRGKWSQEARVGGLSGQEMDAFLIRVCLGLFDDVRCQDAPIVQESLWCVTVGMFKAHSTLWTDVICFIYFWFCIKSWKFPGASCSAMTSSVAIVLASSVSGSQPRTCPVSRQWPGRDFGWLIIFVRFVSIIQYRYQ